MNARSDIHFHIERLAVDESLLANGRAAALQAAVEFELSRLLGEGGLTPPSDSAVSGLRTADIHIVGGTRPARLGRQIARTIHQALTPSNPPARVTGLSSTRGTR